MVLGGPKTAAHAYALQILAPAWARPQMPAGRGLGAALEPPLGAPAEAGHSVDGRSRGADSSRGTWTAAFWRAGDESRAGIGGSSGARVGRAGGRNAVRRACERGGGSAT